MWPTMFATLESQCVSEHTDRYRHNDDVARNGWLMAYAICLDLARFWADLLRNFLNYNFRASRAEFPSRLTCCLVIVTIMQSTSHVSAHLTFAILTPVRRECGGSFQEGASRMKSECKFHTARELTTEELEIVGGGVGVSAGLGAAVTDLLGVSAAVETKLGVNVGGPLGNLLAGNGLLGGLVGGVLGGK